MVPPYPPYSGRFAPSPTGHLHLGSLYTALASFLQARSQQGLWQCRIDDLDTPRTVKGAADNILHTLDSFGLHWDKAVVYQSQQINLYNDVLATLADKNQLYACCCSRKELTTPIYSGACRARHIDPTQAHALRIKTDERIICFTDSLQGESADNIALQHGDFILKRKDGIIAYQFAVVLDDAMQQITDVVRGVDLLTATAKQIYLQQVLGLSTPRYMHVPVIIDEYGYKLSKQTLATAVDVRSPHRVIFQLLQLLKQNPPQELQGASVQELLTWGIAHWQTESLKNLKTISNATISGF